MSPVPKVRCPWRNASPVSQGSALADGLPALTGALPQAESLPQSPKDSALADGSPGLSVYLSPPLCETTSVCPRPHRRDVPSRFPVAARYVTTSVGPACLLGFYALRTVR